MTSTLSKVKHCVQKTTIQRDVGLRIYYFAYMNSPPLFRVPSILQSCYSNYELKTVMFTAEGHATGHAFCLFGFSVYLQKLTLL